MLTTRAWENKIDNGDRMCIGVIDQDSAGGFSPNNLERTATKNIRKIKEVRAVVSSHHSVHTAATSVAMQRPRKP